jgi:glutamine synthetase
MTQNKGFISAERLKALVASGEIDTVVVAFTNVQGRLVGKRVKPDC